MQLGATQGDGLPLRVHLESVEKTTGRVVPQLAAAREPLPTEVAALWSAFAALKSAADGPLRCTEIEAWCRLYRTELTHWEVETLLVLDRAARDAESKPVRKDLSQ